MDEGKLDAAAASIRSFADSTGGGSARGKLLGPYTEISITAGILDAARGVVDELMRMTTATASK